MIKGPIEPLYFIRHAYFGGNSNIFVDNKHIIIPDGYLYVMYYQFPTAKPLPTGNPVFNTNNYLIYYTLGFVFAKFTPPTSDVIPNLFIKSRNKYGTVSCPREDFY